MIIDTPQRSQYVARAVLTDLEVKVAFVVLVRTADLHSTLSFWAQVLDECSAPPHRLIGFGHGAFAEIHRYSNLNAGFPPCPLGPRQSPRPGGTPGGTNADAMKEATQIPVCPALSPEGVPQ